MVLYGQVIVGPPGSGKTTYCNGMQQYLRLIGRETLVVNLDPANEYQPSSNDDDESTNNERQDTKDSSTDDAPQQQSHLPYDTLLDSSEDVINLSSAMDQLNLGPNGGLVYCMEYMEHHLDELLQLLRSRLTAYDPHPPYLLFDFPGQVELYTHCTCVQVILARLVKELDLRLCAVHLVDAHSCTDAAKFISTALLSTTTMLRLELPAVNVLSKIDLIGQYGPESMPFQLDFFMECQELNRLLPFMEGEGGGGQHRSEKETELQWRIEEDEEYRMARERTRNSTFYKRHQKLHLQLCEVIDDFSLLCYMPLNINDAESVGRVVAKIDKCNGYVFTSPTMDSSSNNDATKSRANDMFQCAMQADSQGKFEQVADVQEKYIYRETIPELHGDEIDGCKK
mmetsp:Transcript_671/g.735  ORF Transcript_671/g.735 Transcript_671/m.735 type:complete len:397 (-) Transcript_671:64-1254(-)